MGEYQTMVSFSGTIWEFDADLGHIAGKIYVNFHKRSWGSSKRHFLMLGTPKKLFRELGILAGIGKKGEFEQERILGGSQKSQYRIRLANW